MRKAKYPFSPELLDALPEELAELFRALEDTLLDEVCSRLKIADQLNEVTVQDIRALRSHGIDLKKIKRAIQKTADVSEEKLNKLLDDVVERNQRYYNDLITLADVTKPGRLVDASDIDAIRKQTVGEFRNLTQSMGFLVDNGRKMLPRCKFRAGRSVIIRLLPTPSSSWPRAESKLWTMRAGTRIRSTWPRAGP